MVYAGFYRKEREDEPEFDEYAFAITSRGSMNHILDAETYTNVRVFSYLSLIGRVVDEGYNRRGLLL
jgi:hypothetical protein